VDDEIYGLLPTDAATEFPVFTLTPSPDDGRSASTPTPRSPGGSVASTRCPGK